jgi:hypothetical protein
LSRRSVLASLLGAGAASLQARRLFASIVAEPSAPMPPGPSEIRFEEIAGKSGLHFTTLNSATPNKNQIETMVAGAALFDYDGDGFLDVYLVNGA